MATGCRATNQAGRPCSAAVWQDGWCRWHAPQLEQERRAWSARGGRGKSNKARAAKALPDNVLTPQQIEGMLGLALRGVLAGRVTPGAANAAAALGRALIEIRKATTLEERIAELERAAGVPSKGWSA